VPVLFLVEAAWGFVLDRYGTPELKEKGNRSGGDPQRNPTNG
jgi:hypothetical protein